MSNTRQEAEEALKKASEKKSQTEKIMQGAHQVRSRAYDAQSAAKKRLDEAKKAQQSYEDQLSTAWQRVETIRKELDSQPQRHATLKSLTPTSLKLQNELAQAQKAFSELQENIQSKRAERNLNVSTATNKYNEAVVHYKDSKHKYDEAARNFESAMEELTKATNTLKTFPQHTSPQTKVAAESRTSSSARSISEDRRPEIGEPIKRAKSELELTKIELGVYQREAVYNPTKDNKKKIKGVQKQIKTLEKEERKSNPEAKEHHERLFSHSSLKKIKNNISDKIDEFKARKK